MFLAASLHAYQHRQCVSNLAIIQVGATFVMGKHMLRYGASRSIELTVEEFL
jgi:hypothetical protein